MSLTVTELKDRLQEQIELAKDQTTIGGFSNVMYGFVEIIENDPIFSKFVKIKIDQELDMKDLIWKEYKAKNIDYETKKRLYAIHILFWYKYYCVFKQAHDVIKIDKCNALGIEPDNICQSQLFWYGLDERDYAKHLSEEEIKEYVYDFEQCYRILIGFINSDGKLLEEIAKGNQPMTDKLNFENDKLTFNKERSELNIYGLIVKISLKNDLPVDHFILEAIFENEYWPQEIYFKDVAMDKLKYSSYNSLFDWRKFYRACKHLNEKIKKATDGKILDFIFYTSGRKAWSKINPKYLEKPTK